MTLTETVSLPSPSSLFGTTTYKQEVAPSDRPLYILPPPQAYNSSEYATPTPSPPSYYPQQQPSPPTSSSNSSVQDYLPTPVSTPVDEPSPPAAKVVVVEKQRKRKSKKQPLQQQQQQQLQQQQQQTDSDQPYYKVMALTTKKKKKIDDISAAAATLTSFTQPVLVDRKRKQKFLPANAAMEEGCAEHEDCAGNGKYVCPHCGLTYQHGICLQRHTWDHTGQWSNPPEGTNKRQQVQVLEVKNKTKNKKTKKNEKQRIKCSISCST
ncbi:hypothetical protein BC940DRAFT_158381 [Gongronella butleri]|nr:hypothetical protein BC940DRAFT_158381 [Gongronella butleri]